MDFFPNKLIIHQNCARPIIWPVSTHSVYLAPTTQEDGVTIFMALLLPVLREELHLTYDYRLFSLFGSYEEFFTLRVAQVRIFVEETGALALSGREKWGGR